MAGTTKLLLYNGALEICGERELASLSENREPRRLLDSAWARGAVDHCLEQGQWKFALRSAKLDYSPSVTPEFGYTYAFEQPSDHVRLVSICYDEYFQSPINAYADENRFWFCDVAEIYVRYVSNDNSYGNDLTIWPQSFCRYVEDYLASRVVKKITQSEEKEAKVIKRMEKDLVDARSKDAMAGPTLFPPTGSWVRSRLGGRAGDRGSRGRLIG